jgi:hypothetical protein
MLRAYAPAASGVLYAPGLLFIYAAARISWRTLKRREMA